jgi:predicted transcriptional regulator
MPRTTNAPSLILAALLRARLDQRDGMTPEEIQVFVPSLSVSTLAKWCKNLECSGYVEQEVVHSGRRGRPRFKYKIPEGTPSDQEGSLEDRQEVAEAS